MKIVRGTPGTCGSRSDPPGVPEPGGASLGISPDAKSNKGFTTEMRDTQDECVDGVSGDIFGVSKSAPSRDGAGMAEKESYGGAVGGEDSLRTVDRILDEVLGDGGNGSKNGEPSHGRHGDDAVSAVTLL